MKINNEEKLDIREVSELIDASIIISINVLESANDSFKEMSGITKSNKEHFHDLKRSIRANIHDLNYILDRLELLINEYSRLL